MSEKSWQSRISEQTDKLAQSFVESISYDRRLYKHDIAGSIAHATMLAKVSLVTDAESDALRAKADEEGRSMQEVARTAIAQYVKSIPPVRNKIGKPAQ